MRGQLDTFPSTFVILLYLVHYGDYDEKGVLFATQVGLIASRWSQNAFPLWRADDQYGTVLDTLCRADVAKKW